MSLAVELDVLKRMPLFETVDPGKLKLLAVTGQRLPCTAGDTLFRQDEPADCVYVVLSGELEVLRETDTGAVQLAKVGSGAILGEIGVLCERPRTATVRAWTDAKVLRLEDDLFVEFVRELPALSMAIIRELSERLDLMNQRLAQTSNAPS